MKKLFSSIIALSFAVTGFNSVAETAYPDASPEANPAPAASEAPAPAPAQAAPAVRIPSNVVVPQEIVEHLTVRFPGQTVYGIAREGVTYVVDLGNGLHIRYDNCFNPVCYGVHNHNH
ncbi:MAG: hypothetical protein K2N09_10220 [Muribaculaceae bacterium]|nr:hypothetical protein [Muribaculaceae bacterium]